MIFAWEMHVALQPERECMYNTRARFVHKYILYITYCQLLTFDVVDFSIENRERKSENEQETSDFWKMILEHGTYEGIELFRWCCCCCCCYCYCTSAIILLRDEIPAHYREKERERKLLLIKSPRKYERLCLCSWQFERREKKNWFEAFSLSYII